MSTQQQPVANENLSGIGMVVKSVDTLTEAGFGEDQSLALAKAISGIISTEISACMKPFMDETSRRFQAIDDRLEDMEKVNKARFQAVNDRFQAIDDRLEAMEKVNQARFESVNDRLAAMEEVNKARFEAVNDRLEDMGEVDKARFESTGARLKSVEGKVDWMQKVMVTFAVGMGGSIVALTTLFFGAVLIILGK